MFISSLFLFIPNYNTLLSLANYVQDDIQEQILQSNPNVSLEVLKSVTVASKIQDWTREFIEQPQVYDVIKTQFVQQLYIELDPSLHPILETMLSGDKFQIQDAIRAWKSKHGGAPPIEQVAKILVIAAQFQLEPVLYQMLTLFEPQIKEPLKPTTAQRQMISTKAVMEEGMAEELAIAITSMNISSAPLRLLFQIRPLLKNSHKVYESIVKTIIQFTPQFFMDYFISLYEGNPLLLEKFMSGEKRNSELFALIQLYFFLLDSNPMEGEQIPSSPIDIEAIVPHLTGSSALAIEHALRRSKFMIKIRKWQQEDPQSATLHARRLLPILSKVIVEANVFGASRIIELYAGMTNFFETDKKFTLLDLNSKLHAGLFSATLKFLNPPLEDVKHLPRATDANKIIARIYTKIPHPIGDLCDDKSGRLPLLRRDITPFLMGDEMGMESDTPIINWFELKASERTAIIMFLLERSFGIDRDEAITDRPLYHLSPNLHAQFRGVEYCKKLGMKPRVLFMNQ